MAFSGGCDYCGVDAAERVSMSVGKRSKAQVEKVRQRVYDRDGGCVVAGCCVDAVFDGG